MGLIIKNIGGIRKGVEDMGVLGNPGKYSMVIAENEEGSPWEPFRVSEGFDRGESSVTLFFPNCYNQIWPYGSDDRGILNAIAYNLLPARGGLTCIILTPPHAKILENKGWTKETIKEFLFRFGRVPAYRHPYFWDTNKAFARLGAIPFNEMDTMAVLVSPAVVKIIVAGGPGAFIGIAAGAVSFSPTREKAGDWGWVSKKITLPANWEKLVAQYKNVVPTYERY